MRVCLISHSDSPWTPHYARHLADQGWDVQVISFHPKEIPGIDVHHLGAPWLGDQVWLWKILYLWRVPAVRRLLRRLEPDVVLATYFRSNGLVGALARRGPLVVSTRGPGDYEFWLPFGLERRLVRWIAGRADLVHASSPELVEGLVEIGVPHEKCEVIPLGIDASRFEPRDGPRPPGPLRIVCTRKHLPIYDIPTVIRALARLRDRGIEFEARFVGSGNRLPFSRRLVQKLDLEDRVEFLGEVESAAVRDHLVWADVYVSATLSDGSPSSLFEAMSCQVFPVVTDIRANRDWIIHGENGHLFEPGDDEQCADGILAAWSEWDERVKGLEASGRRVATELDRKVGLVRLERLLERAVAIGRARVGAGAASGQS